MLRQSVKEVAIDIAFGAIVGIIAIFLFSGCAGWRSYQPNNSYEFGQKVYEDSQKPVSPQFRGDFTPLPMPMLISNPPKTQEIY